MNTKRQFVLGVFFLASLSVLVFYTLFFTDFTLFQEPVEETVYFPDAGGLREGDPVMVAGLRIGRVGTLTFDIDAPNERRIGVQLLLDEAVPLRSDYEISIEETTMLGGHHVEIEPGRFEGQALARSGGVDLMGSVAPNPLAALGSVGDLFDDNSEALSGILRNLEQAVAKINSGQGPAGRLVNDEAMGRDLSEAIGSIRTVAENLAQATADVNAGRGVIGALLHDQQLVDDLKGTVTDIRNLASELNAGRGTFGRFLKDDTLADEFEAGVRSLSNFAQNLESGEGTIGKLINDPELASQVASVITNLETATSDLAAIVEHVRSGEGTVGRLVMNDELYEEILVAVGLLTRSLEDFREAAPITSLTGVLFSAF